MVLPPGPPTCIRGTPRKEAERAQPAAIHVSAWRFWVTEQQASRSKKKISANVLAKHGKVEMPQGSDRI